MIMKNARKIPIYTLTPNPALDLSGHVARLVPNEKNYVFEERRDPGGNGINSARIAHRLGGTKVTALGFIGGSTGEEITGMLAKEGVPARFTQIQGHTRINVTATNDADHRQTRLTFPGPTISRAECRALLNQVARLKGPGIFLLGGSLPKGVPARFHQALAVAAKARGLGVIADVPGKYIDCLAAIRGGKGKENAPLLMIKPNQNELEEYVGRALRTDGEIIHAAKGLIYGLSPRGFAALVCVSLAERGAILLSADRCWIGTAPHVKARGTVGAGDSLVGAFASRLAQAGIANYEDMEAPGSLRAIVSALSWGMAAGAATASASGTSLARASDICRLQRKSRIKELNCS
jgi:6-phosphofructokinase 2